MNTLYERIKNSGIWDDTYIYNNVIYSKRVSDEIPFLKRIIAEPLFDSDHIYKIHLRRVDLKKVDNKDKFIELTNQLCLFSVYKFENQYFFKFGCLFFNNSYELIKLSKSDMLAFARKLQKEHLEKHLNKRDAEAVALKHIDFLIDFIERKELVKDIEYLLDFYKKRSLLWVMDQQRIQV